MSSFTGNNKCGGINMSVGEFLNHIKHKSLKIRIVDRDVEFEGTLGEYETSLVKSEINYKLINIVFPDEFHPGGLVILLAVNVAEEE
jgi:hypothetical protein